jgi:hypothetical protein
MATDGDRALMAEYIKEEKRLGAAMDEVNGRLEAPREKLERSREVLMRAKSAFDQAKAAVEALESDRILLEGELDLVREKKSRLRVEAQVAEGGGIRPGTAELAEQMDELAGDAETYRVKQETQALDVEDELARLKAAMEPDPNA